MVILGSDFLVRALKLRVRTATLVSLSDSSNDVGTSSFTQLSIPSIQSGWNPGSHVWIRRLSGLKSLEVHPFSIAHSSATVVKGHSNQTRKKGLTIYAKSCGDWTRSLNEAAREGMERLDGKQSQPATCRVMVEGPYGGQLLSSLQDNENILLVAGGSGVSPVCFLPLLRRHD
jgi:predicted ferric reductase